MKIAPFAVYPEVLSKPSAECDPYPERSRRYILEGFYWSSDAKIENRLSPNYLGELVYSIVQLGSMVATSL
jgi:hypothetical protein